MRNAWHVNNLMKIRTVSVTFPDERRSAADKTAQFHNLGRVKTKKSRPRLESMAAEDKSIELDIHERSRILLALCGARAKEMAVRKHQLRTATKIANQLADAWGLPHQHCAGNTKWGASCRTHESGFPLIQPGTSWERPRQCSNEFLGLG